MLAEALAPHGGIVIWRAFVYANEKPDDRAKQAYDEFVPLDGKFRDNVLVQSRTARSTSSRANRFIRCSARCRRRRRCSNSRSRRNTGFATHLVYLGRCTRKRSRRHVRARQGSTVAKVIDGSLYATAPKGWLTGMAGVANIGSDRNWRGSHFDQANWYVFGRLAWNPSHRRGARSRKTGCA
jgi:alpha-glucuronidase